jgi:hypothetical protein
MVDAKTQEPVRNVVSIRPGPSVLSVLRHLNYKPWFALAEFVDNALQSYIANAEKLAALHGQLPQLDVAIVIDPAAPARIKIRDNAAGIALADFPRAFRPAVAPLDTSGLHEFGMGMKSAACWFSSTWSVRTKTLGDPIERTVRFDISKIVKDDLEELTIDERPAPIDHHYTEVILDGLYHVPVKRTLGKIKQHLGDIYRVFTRKGLLNLTLDGEVLTHKEPAILVAAYDREADKGERVWRKEINFKINDKQSVTGFAGLRDPGSFSDSGFALFRRGRLIEGSGEDGYRPPFIFGSPNSFRQLRLFGELHLFGFEISHTKDGFRWNDDEQPMLDMLKQQLDSDELPLLRQADSYRALASKKDRTKAAEEALARTATSLELDLPPVLTRLALEEPSETSVVPLPQQSHLATKTLEVNFRDEKWLITIDLSDDPSEGDWLSISADTPDVGQAHTLHIRISMLHPFMVAFAQTSAEEIDAVIRIATAVALAEKLARSSGVRHAGTVRRNLNDILRDALSRP